MVGVGQPTLWVEFFMMAPDSLMSGLRLRRRMVEGTVCADAKIRVPTGCYSGIIRGGGQV